MENRMNFTEEELLIHSNGILALIHNAESAKELVTDNNTISAINVEVEKLVRLNNKVCIQADIQEKISRKEVYKYDFLEGDKGVVFAVSEEMAMEKVLYIYGSEYCDAHKLKIKETEMWDTDVFCTESTWN